MINFKISFTRRHLSTAPREISGLIERHARLDTDGVLRTSCFFLFLCFPSYFCFLVAIFLSLSLFAVCLCAAWCMNKRCSTTASSSCASTSPMRSYSNTSIIICSCSNKKSTSARVLLGPSSISAWISNRLLI